jgi:ribosomal protein S18 acetylase RimI-like enzyme
MAALGSLMFAAYRGTVDDEGETEAAALAEIQKTYAGAYGAFVPLCSRVVERAGRLVSATLITRWQERPFVAFSVTDPDSKRAGLARACMVGAMQCLRAAGESELRLVVTLANTPAVNLYNSLGFAVEE